MDFDTQIWLRVMHDMNRQTTWFIEVIFFCTLFFHIRFTPSNIHKAPAFLTTLGILGTFIGIAFGLLDFNPNDVQKSVPTLIDGIKTAVWASAFGIFCALTVKLRDILTAKKKISAKGASGATINDLAVILKKIEQSIGKVEQALISNAENSLLSQIKLTRQDSNNQLTMLGRSLDGFCDNVAESNAKALVKALNEVIREFNVKLNEQFGDNFKELNIAVGKMLVWQEHYTQQMADMIEQQHSASANMTIASERYQSLVERAEIFNTIAGNMSGLLTGLETQRSEVEESLRSLATLINTASTGLPNIEKQIIEMTQQVAGGVKATNDEFNIHIKQIIEKTREQVSLLDSALSEELTKSLESFGKQMASLSQKFAEDYTPITERLKSVLNIAG